MRSEPNPAGPTGRLLRRSLLLTEQHVLLRVLGNAMKPPSRKRTQHGVLLLEAMVAILIFSIAFLGLVAMQAKATQISIESEGRNTAALLANEIISTMWAQQTVDASSLSAEIETWKTRV